MPVDSDDPIPKYLTIPPPSEKSYKPTFKMSVLFELTIDSIFNKFDVKQEGILTYNLFKAFCDSVDRKMNPTIFDSLVNLLVST